MKGKMMQCRSKRPDEAVMGTVHEPRYQNDTFVMVSLLKAYTEKSNLDEGFRLHADILRTDLLKTNIFVGSALISLYAKCSAFTRAEEVFHQLEDRNVVSWNALISGYAQDGQGNEALRCFQQMQSENILPDAVTFVCALKACASIRTLNKGKEIHSKILKDRLPSENILVGNGLLDVYCKCDALAKARETFEDLQGQNVVSWNIIITGYTQHGNGAEALDCFSRMQCESMCPNGVTFLCILKACSSLGALHKIIQVHAKIVNEESLEENDSIHSLLVDVYAKCGALARAQHTFDHLPAHGIAAWTALIGGCADRGYGEKSFKCFEQMQHESVLPNAVAFICMLKACSRVGALNKGKQVHAMSSRCYLFGDSTVLRTSLADMYVKCGALRKALDVFEEIEVHNIVSWNVLIVGYARQRHLEEALSCYKWMQCEGFMPDAVTFISILNACGSVKATHVGQEVHSEIVKSGLLECNVLVGNALVDMYAKCCVLSEAEHVFNKLRVHDVACWNAVISGCAQQGHSARAIHYYQKMQEHHISPTAVTFVCVLKACGDAGEITKGKDLHGKIMREGLLESNVLIGNAVVDMYAKCCDLVKAHMVFDELPVRDTVSWNVLIAGYVQHELDEQVLECFEQMQYEGLSPNGVTVVCILKACGNLGDVIKGEEIHAEIVKDKSWNQNVMVGTELVATYAKCGKLQKAQEVFDGLQMRDSVSWNALILGYSQQEDYKNTLDCFERMQHDGLYPDVYTLVCILRAYGNLGITDMADEVYAHIIGDDTLLKDVLVCTALLEMYIRFGDLQRAHEIFDKFSVHDTVSWNTLIAGYVEHGYAEKALYCFEQMQNAKIHPDEFTFVNMLNACAIIRSAAKCEEIYSIIVKEGLDETNVLIYNILVNTYAKCGALTKAQEVFNRIQSKDVYSWNVMNLGYAQHGCDDEVLSSFEKMQQDGVAPDASTFLYVLKACGNIVAVGKGKEVHDAIMRGGYLKDVSIGNALIDMYSKFFLIRKAQEVFDKLPVKDAISWTVLISGYAQVGKDNIVVALFHKMLGEGIEPDVITFTVVLNACSHSGLVDEGRTCFNNINVVYGLAPTLEHWTCMIDLSSRAGQFEEAVATIKQMPVSDYLPAWIALLGACQKWGNVELGRIAFDHAVRLDAGFTPAYICMSNVYAAERTGEVE